MISLSATQHCYSIKVQCRSKYNQYMDLSFWPKINVNFSQNDRHSDQINDIKQIGKDDSITLLYSAIRPLEYTYNEKTWERVPNKKVVLNIYENIINEFLNEAKWFRWTSEEQKSKDS
ncbi:unnamed protein product [Rhizophagus irregularis]|nr:unnamed protein product [Rhizophagus irregularis]